MNLLMGTKDALDLRYSGWLNILIFVAILLYL